MAVAFDAAANAGNAAAQSSVSYSHTIASGAAIVIVGGGTSAARTVDTVTVGGSGATAMHTTQTNSGGANGIHARMFGHASPSSGSQTVAVTWSASTTCSAVSVSFTGQQASPFGTPVTEIGPTDTSVDVSSASGDMVLDELIGDLENTCAGSTYTVGANQTEPSMTPQQPCADNAVKLGTSYEAGAATVTMSWTAPNIEYIHIGVNVIQAAAGGRTTKNTRAFPLGMAIGMNWVGPGQCS